MLPGVEQSMCKTLAHAVMDADKYLLCSRQASDPGEPQCWLLFQCKPQPVSTSRSLSLRARMTQESLSSRKVSYSFYPDQWTAEGSPLFRYKTGATQSPNSVLPFIHIYPHRNRTLTKYMCASIRLLKYLWCTQIAPQN